MGTQSPWGLGVSAAAWDSPSLAEGWREGGSLRSVRKILFPNYCTNCSLKFYGLC